MNPLKECWKKSSSIWYSWMTLTKAWCCMNLGQIQIATGIILMLSHYQYSLNPQILLTFRPCKCHHHFPWRPLQGLEACSYAVACKGHAVVCIDVQGACSNCSSSGTDICSYNCCIFWLTWTTSIHITIVNLKNSSSIKIIHISCKLDSPSPCTNRDLDKIEILWWNSNSKIFLSTNLNLTWTQTWIYKYRI